MDAPTPVILPDRDIYTISRLNREARILLETGFPLLWVQGEISNLARPSSGHLYFTLKDSLAQVRCAMFRMRNRNLSFRPSDGMQVLARARVGLYENRGEFQIVVEHLEEAGAGALQRAFDALKERLAARGLFDADHKQPLPTLPRRIGVITSPTGAALRDILSVLQRRFPAIEVLVYPVPVQGEGAAIEIASMLQLACVRAECDVLLIARGGGSLEDLWAFNEEVLALAIYDCALPVVTGIGHEIDFTIADFVADQRAPTPSAAAELLSPNAADWLGRITALQTRLQSRCAESVQRKTQQLRWLERHLQQQHPGQRLRNHAQRLDELEQRLRYARRNSADRHAARIAELFARLQRHNPEGRIATLRARVEGLQARLRSSVAAQFARNRHQLAVLSRALETVSPLGTLARGYAIVSKAADARILRDAREVRKGDRINARLARGTLTCRVDTIDRAE